MKAKIAPSNQSIQWLPAERLGQLHIDSNVRPWLIGKGALSERMKAVCGQRFSLRLVDQWTGLLTSSQKLGLQADDNAGLYRDIEMYRDDKVWVFAQTVTPDSTLCRHPWLAELGDTALDETLSNLSGVEYSSYEFAWLTSGDASVAGSPGGDPLTTRALREAEVKPAGLWARRSRVALRGAPLLVQELFLPALSLA